MKTVIERYEIVVIEKLPAGWIVKCAKCKGSGIEPGSHSSNCYSCGGAGKRKLMLPDDRDTSFDWGPVFCGYCQGSGIEPSTHSSTCPLCDGRGVRVGGFPRVVCGKCKGKGIEPGTYSSKCLGHGCNGRGTIYVGSIR